MIFHLAHARVLSPLNHPNTPTRGACVVWLRFERALSFNQNIDGWAVGSVETMAFAFNQATAFGQDLS